MSKAVFQEELGGSTTIQAQDTAGTFTLQLPAADGTLVHTDTTGTATFDNLSLAGAVVAGAWDADTIDVAHGGTGAVTLTGYVKGAGTAAMTASATIPNTDITGLGTMSVQDANAVAITGGTISGLSSPIAVTSGGSGAATLTGYVKGNGTSAMTASATIPNTDVTGLGTMSTQGADSVAITGGTANGLTIGAINPAAVTATTLRVNSTISLAGSTGTAGQVLTSNGGSAPTWQNIPGTGDVVGPASATDNALARFDTTTGKLIQNSQVLVDDNGNATGVNSVTFDTTPATPPTTEGSLYWDNADSIQTLNLVMAGGNATQHIGQETYYRVKASSAITNGQVVMFTGTIGASGGLTAAPATGLTAATASYVLGIATQDIPLNEWGYVTHFGEVKQIDTSAFSNGDILYYDPTTPGGLTTTIPAAPNAKVQVCAVVNSSATVGILFVRPAFGGTLGQYEGDVQITSPVNGQFLVRDQTAGKWVNSALDLSSPPTIGNTTPNSGAFTTLSSTGNTTIGDASTDTVTINGSTTANAPVVVSTNSSTTALRITQTGTGNALLVEDSANPDASPFVVAADGNVIIGGTTALGTGLTLVNSGSFTPVITSRNTTADSGYTYADFQKSRAGAIVQSGDGLGGLIFSGFDGAAQRQAGSIVGAVDGTPGTNDMPGRLVFSTTADGASSPTEAMRIDNQRRVGIGATPFAGSNIFLGKTITGAVTSYGFYQGTSVQSDVTSGAIGYMSSLTTQAAAFTLPSLIHYRAAQSTLGAGSTVTNQYGFEAASSLTGATNNYGFFSNIASGTGRWNFYAAGTARNYFAGGVEDSYGNVRSIPKSGAAKTTSYTLATTDNGQFIEVGSGGSITIPDATFSAGDAVSVFNNTSGNVTITCTITTAYIGGTDADKATVTLATRGVATILFISGTVCVISGNVT